MSSIAENHAAAPAAAVKKLSVLMPLYNERWTLATIIRRVLAVPLDLELELIVVDDGSSDGSWEELQRVTAGDARIRVFRHDRNRGKGAAIRTAIAQMTGDVAVVQDADLEYDPNDYLRLLTPIRDGRADAVFGSRFAGETHRVLYFWHSVGNKLLTLLANMANDVNLTDMETCYKMVRADVLRQLRLRSNTFTLEPEITCRLAQWGARIYEVPISYSGRTYLEGKKIKAIDGFKVFGELFRCRFLDPRFTHHHGLYVLKSIARARNFNRWLLAECRPWLGDRILEAGAGIGSLSALLLSRARLVLLDRDATFIRRLEEQFGQRGNVRVIQADLTMPEDAALWKDEAIDTVLCCGVLEHVGPDEEVLRSLRDALQPGGHCIVVVPAQSRLYNALDRRQGHQRRYDADELREKMERAGFEVVCSRSVGKLSALAWRLWGGLLRRRRVSPRQTVCADRLFPLTRRLDCCLPGAGATLIMVGRRRP
jgi:glycosyltransferase involved in cell wall biosynthesis